MIKKAKAIWMIARTMATSFGVDMPDMVATFSTYGATNGGTQSPPSTNCAVAVRSRNFRRPDIRKIATNKIRPIR